MAGNEGLNRGAGEDAGLKYSQEIISCILLKT